jgi:hypothetical protein
MSSVRDSSGKIVKGTGAKLTPLQETFINEVRKKGLSEASSIARELNYTSYHRDKATIGTAFYHKLHNLAAEIEADIAVSKGMNLDRLIFIRDNALDSGDFKTAMEAIKIINDMSGHKAPVKVQQTKVDIKATIDLTRPVEDGESQAYLDIDYTEEDGD